MDVFEITWFSFLQMSFLRPRKIKPAAQGHKANLVEATRRKQRLLDQGSSQVGPTYSPPSPLFSLREL